MSGKFEDIEILSPIRWQGEVVEVDDESFKIVVRNLDPIGLSEKEDWVPFYSVVESTWGLIEPGAHFTCNIIPIDDEEIIIHAIEFGC